MARPRKAEDEKRQKWPVLNVTSAERAAIEAGAKAAGLGINAYLIACTQQTRLVRRGDDAVQARLLARIESQLDGLARDLLAAPLPAAEVAKLLLALQRIETALAPALPTTPEGLEDRQGEEADRSEPRERVPSEPDEVLDPEPDVTLRNVGSSPC